MEYADTVVRVVRLSVRNPFAVVLVSVGSAVSVVPFLTGILVADVVGGVVGLWTTSILLGFVGVGGARISTVVIERKVSLGTSYFWEGVREGTRMALAVGIGTFFVATVAFILALNPAEGVVRLSIVLFGVYALMGWCVLTMFSLTVWASSEPPRSVRTSFSDGGRLILEHPIAVGWLVVQAVGWALLSIPLIIAPIIVLPGFVQLLGTAIVRRAAESDDSRLL